MGQIDTILSSDQLAMLRDNYRRDDMTQLLSSGIPGLDESTADYIHAIRVKFYESSRMKPKHRELCLIGILAARDAGLNLALHVYMGLMEGLSPADISDVIFLGGIYTGVDRISDGLDTVMRTLSVLARLARPPMDCTVVKVATALRATFKPPLPSPQ